MTSALAVLEPTVCIESIQTVPANMTVHELAPIVMASFARLREYKNVPLGDAACVSPEDFNICIGFIQAHLNYGHKILVHCNAGRNRSAAIVTGFLLATGQFADWQTAFNYVKSKRASVGCNSKVKESVRMLAAEYAVREFQTLQASLFGEVRENRDVVTVPEQKPTPIIAPMSL